jgi:hypothetical protein
METIRAIGTALLVCCASLATSHTSDFTGTYARIDKVVFEPSAEAPERVQIWGVSAVCDPAVPAGYRPAARGYVYFTLDHSPASNRLWRDPERTLIEWNDLKGLAGSGQIVAFGTRMNPAPRVRRADDKPANPDFYTMNSGAVRVSGDTEYPPIKAIAEFKR